MWYTAIAGFVAFCVVMLCLMLNACFSPLTTHIVFQDAFICPGVILVACAVPGGRDHIRTQAGLQAALCVPGAQGWIMKTMLHTDCELS